MGALTRENGLCHVTAPASNAVQHGRARRHTSKEFPHHGPTDAEELPKMSQAKPHFGERVAWGGIRRDKGAKRLYDAGTDGMWSTRSRAGARDNRNIRCKRHTPQVGRGFRMNALVDLDHNLFLPVRHLRKVPPIKLGIAPAPHLERTRFFDDSKGALHWPHGRGVETVSMLMVQAQDNKACLILNHWALVHNVIEMTCDKNIKADVIRCNVASHQVGHYLGPGGVLLFLADMHPSHIRRVEAAALFAFMFITPSDIKEMRKEMPWLTKDFVQGMLKALKAI